jgi:hypothetical protein
MPTAARNHGFFIGSECLKRPAENGILLKKVLPGNGRGS